MGGMGIGTGTGGVLEDDDDTGNLGAFDIGNEDDFDDDDDDDDDDGEIDEEDPGDEIGAFW